MVHTIGKENEIMRELIASLTRKGFMQPRFKLTASPAKYMCPADLLKTWGGKMRFDRVLFRAGCLFPDARMALSALLRDSGHPGPLTVLHWRDDRNGLKADLFFWHDHQNGLKADLIGPK